MKVHHVVTQEINQMTGTQASLHLISATKPAILVQDMLAGLVEDVRLQA